MGTSIPVNDNVASFGEIGRDFKGKRGGCGFFPLDTIRQHRILIAAFGAIPAKAWMALVEKHSLESQRKTA